MIATLKINTLDASLKRIDAYQEQGKTLCLFVGRTPAEKLPSETGEANPNEIWVSGDISDTGPAINPDRIHLHFDFNEQRLIEKLKRKFDLIVIDLAVAHSLRDDFANRFSEMLRSFESKMILEAFSGLMAFDLSAYQPRFDSSSYMLFCPLSAQLELIKKKEACLENYRRVTPQDKQQADWQEFLKARDESGYSHWPQDALDRDREVAFMHLIAEREGIKMDDSHSVAFAVQELISHLKKTFAQVELKQDQPYPYKNSLHKPVSYLVVSQHHSFNEIVKVYFSLPKGHHLTIRGKGAGLNWNQGIPLQQVDDVTFMYRSSTPVDTPVEFKILLDDERGEKGDILYRVEPGSTAEIVPNL